MKRIVSIILVLITLSAASQTLTLSKGLTMAQTRTIVNNTIKVKSESLYRGNSANMDYLPASWTAANLRNYVNVLYDSIQASYPTCSLTDIRYGMTGKTLINTYNTNLTEIARAMQYQTYPVGSYKILGQRNNIKIAQYNGDTLRASLDGGATWTKSKYLALADSVTICEIFGNGTIIIATEQPHLYRSTDTLTTLTEINLKAKMGGNYAYHIPVDWHYPGDYFQTLTEPATGYNGNKEIKVWGNYVHSGSRNGSAPVNLYYSVNGDSVRVAYTFKVNRYDDGTAGGNSTTGTALGDPAAKWQISHIHDVTWNSNDSTFWFCSGDTPSTGIWTFKATYYPAGDTMHIEEVMKYQAGGVTYTNAPQYKIAGFYIEGDSITWAADVDPVTDANRRWTGIFRAKITEFSDTTKLRHLWTAGESLVGLEHTGTTLITGGYSGTSVFVSFDNGETWETITLNTGDFTSYSYFKKFQSPDANGYFLIQGQYRNYNTTTASKSVLFKPLAP